MRKRVGERQRTFAKIFLITVIGFSGCKGSPTQNSSTEPDLGTDATSTVVNTPSAFQSFCEQVNESHENWRSRCFPYFEIPPRCGQGFEWFATSGKIALDEEAISICLEALDRKECGRSWIYARSVYGNTFTDIVPECISVFAGTVPHGGSCYPPNDGINHLLFGSECAAGWCLADESCPGTCRPYLDAGDDCSVNPRSCGPDLWCDDEDRCRPRVTKGGRCTDTDACEAGLDCLPGVGFESIPLPENPTERFCDVSLSVGTECDTGFDLCGPSTRCINSVCEPRVFNEPCVATDLCPPRHVCDPASKTCIRDIAEGLGCLRAVECGPGFECVDRQCMFVREPCWANSHCREDEWCGRDQSTRWPDPVEGANGLFCQPEGASGAPCLPIVDPSEDCGAGLTCLAPTIGAHGRSRCSALRQSGETCPSLEWAETCIEGLECTNLVGDGFTERVGSCEPMPEPGQLGDSCRIVPRLRCDVGLGCVCGNGTDTFCTGGQATCQPPIGEGEPCIGGEDCQVGMSCEFDDAGVSRTCERSSRACVSGR